MVVDHHYIIITIIASISSSGGGQNTENSIQWIVDDVDDVMIAGLAATSSVYTGRHG